MPLRPTLEHLKNQAKDLLHEWQQRDPTAQLTDAQHALARDYGFASWPKLKAFVDSVASTLPEPHSPFDGQWMANLSKSRRHPANPFRSAIVEFEVSGETVRVTDVVVDECGREERRVNTIRADDREHLPDRNGYTLRAGWRNPHVLETVARKDGEVVGRGTYEVSADGKTLTLSADQQSIVFDRLG